MLVLLSVRIISKPKVYMTVLGPLPAQECILVNTSLPLGKQTCRRVFIAVIPVTKSRENGMLDHQHRSGPVIILLL